MLDRQDPRQGIRLHASTRSTSRSEGVAISAGAAAVIINGANAELVWSHMEPILRAGCTPESLTRVFPKQGRALVETLLSQLDSHDLLRDLEPPPAGDIPPTLDHFEQLTRRPYAAAERLAATTLHVCGSSLALNAAVVAALDTMGAAAVVSRYSPREPTDPVATVRVYGSTSCPETPGTPSTEELIATALVAGGWHAVGPTNSKARQEDADRVAEWLALRQDSADAPAAPPLGMTLVGAQTALAVMAAVARQVTGNSSGEETSGGQTPAQPLFMVTSPDLVSEPHPVTTLGVLHLDDRHPEYAVARPAPGAKDDDVQILEGLEPLWAGLLTVIEGPSPKHFEQIPVGLAEAGITGAAGWQNFPGAGLTTAQARLDALAAAATYQGVQVASPAFREWLDGRHGVLAVSWTGGAAAADAVALLADSAPGWEEIPAADIDLSPRCRRMWAALALRFGREVRVMSAALHMSPAGLPLGSVIHRSQVFVDGVLSATGIAPSAPQSLEEALLRAVGIEQFRRQGPPPGCRMPRSTVPALETTRASLLDWAAANNSLLLLRSPDVAGTWAHAGLFAVAGAWR